MQLALDFSIIANDNFYFFYEFYEFSPGEVVWGGTSIFSTNSTNSSERGGKQGPTPEIEYQFVANDNFYLFYGFYDFHPRRGEGLEVYRIPFHNVGCQLSVKQ